MRRIAALAPSLGPLAAVLLIGTSVAATPAARADDPPVANPDTVTLAPGTEGVALHVLANDTPSGGTYVNDFENAPKGSGVFLDYGDDGDLWSTPNRDRPRRPTPSATEWQTRALARSPRPRPSP